MQSGNLNIQDSGRLFLDNDIDHPDSVVSRIVSMGACILASSFSWFGRQVKVVLRLENVDLLDRAESVVILGRPAAGIGASGRNRVRGNGFGAGRPGIK